MLLKIISRIPLLQCLINFPARAHKAAGKKFAALYILSSLPVICAVILSPIPAGTTDIGTALIGKLLGTLTISELFIYTASFITPILYLLYERYDEIPKEELEKEITRSVKKIFRGYGVVAILALLAIIFTTAAFSSLKTNAEYFSTSFLHHYLGQNAWWIYLFALYCWYLSLLDGASGGNFVDKTRKSEESVSAGLAARLRNRGESDD
jgi:hypothetical protein